MKPSLLTSFAILLSLHTLVLAAEPPATLLDLSNWKITLPVDTDRPGHPDEITRPALDTFFDPDCFFLSPEGDAVLFRARCDGKTTKNSKYPRCELREMNSAGTDEIDWSTNDNSRHELQVELAINATPVKKPHVVCAQIHDGKDDLVMIRLERRKLFIEREGEPDVSLIDDYKLGQRVKLNLIAQAGHIRVLCNDVEKLNWKKSSTGCYFKTGCYTQSNTDRGDKADASGEVALYHLAVTHTPVPSEP